ncbi:hypothetical protein TRICI_000626 [Trichomonascus ciferrii]|uniref:Uncharacterized protein n=1 Tax=Trichomonascus ciferrii TaxID=44093 RepID=A0A642VBL3_9ASCO|nr:hypothetical protein TRICI_000626 [Trichomonascus ciferrii]
MQFWRREKVEYSPEDTKRVVNGEIDRIKYFLGDEVYVTSSGVVTGKQVSQELENKLFGEGSGRTTVGLVSLELDIGRDVVGKKISELKESRLASEFYVDGDNLYPRKELVRLADELNNELEVHHALSCLEFCSKFNVDLKTLHWLVDNRLKGGVVIVDGKIVVQSVWFESYKCRVIERMNQVDEPSSLDNINCDDIPVLVRQLLLTPDWIRNCKEIEGGFSKTGEFVPRKYTEAKRQGCVEKLEQDGLVSMQDLFAVGIKHPITYLESNSDNKLYFYTDYVITEGYLAETLSNINEDLQNVGFCEVLCGALSAVESTDDRVAIYKGRLASKIGKETRTVAHKNDVDLLVVAAKYLQDTEKMMVQYYNSQAEEDAKTLLNEKLKLSQFDIESDEDDLNKVILDQSDVRKHTSVQALRKKVSELLQTPPPDGYMPDFIDKLLREKVVSSYQTTLLSTFKGHLAHKSRQDLLKLYVHLQAILDVKPHDAKLANKLYTELAEYASKLSWKVRDLISSASDPNNLNDKLQATDDIREHDVDLTKQSLQANLLRHVSIATDPPLILHLSVLVVHSQTCSTNGVLRASGKHVPKILKLLTETPLFDEFSALKDAIIQKHPQQEQADLAESIKTQLHV